MKVIKNIILSILIMLFSTNINANTKKPNITEEIKTYIRNIKSIAVEFTQTDSHNLKASGMLIINKPHKFRCNYYEPFPLLIVGNKNYISVYDYEMEHLSRIKAEENIFNFLLVDNINFENHFEIISASSLENEYFIKLKSIKLNKISEITFSKINKHLKRIKIYEDNNIITLDFDATKTISNISNNLFILQDPDIFGKPNRLNKEELLKKFQQ